MHDEFKEKLIIQLAPTGMVPTKKDTPHVPITPKEIAADTYKAYRLGASVVHLHARGEDGRPTYKKEVYEEIFSRVREKCPDIVICASTSGRLYSDIDQRAEVLELGPEMASLTVGSLNFPSDISINSIETIKDLAIRMARRGIKPELEIFESGFINTAQYLAKKGYFKAPLHFNLLLGSLGSIPADLRDHVYLVESIPRGDTWSAAGIGRYQARINVAAILMGGHVRVGIEDSIYYDYTTRELATNERLVRRIARIAKELGREIATPADARKILGLNARH
ncbi:MAG TPA: 3-keto-5-aminohexanoate cleavage protein [Methanocella sp.]|uniref:3-keto-5-aminohexanoate cleavage protein n=1 Tax=Methanocella sp. TaxID=2052833 RepID=UPI002CC80A31|nr:3-keto-5-aminohexanoate cleavage protein [Methanocella sp.]HTY90807.1 3-keto-5-aminohexanoate cleavage protein [Methanocella sp.]